MHNDKTETKCEVLSMQEYLDRRKARQSIDRNGLECYDVLAKRFLNTKEITIWHY